LTTLPLPAVYITTRTGHKKRYVVVHIIIYFNLKKLFPVMSLAENGILKKTKRKDIQILI